MRQQFTLQENGQTIKLNLPLSVPFLFKEAIGAGGEWKREGSAEPQLLVQKRRGRQTGVCHLEGPDCYFFPHLRILKDEGVRLKLRFGESAF